MEVMVFPPSKRGGDSRAWRLRIAAVFLAAASLAAGSRLASAAERDFDAAFHEQLKSLAAKCRELKLPDQAEVTQRWFIPRAPDRQYLFVPLSQPLHEPPATADKIEQQWYGRFREIRAEQAKRLWASAEEAAQGGDAATAYRLIHETLHEDPDHAAARKALGYRVVNGKWRRTYDAVRSRKPQLGQPLLKWQPGDYWRCESRHFEVLTDRDADTGRLLAERLEEFHTVWRQLFPEFWTTPDQIQLWIQRGRRDEQSRRRHQVAMFRNRDGYLAAFTNNAPLVSQSIGYYATEKDISLFFFDGAGKENAWHHEVTHQLFQESRPSRRASSVAASVGADGHFWVVEAIALYLESATRYDGYYTVGGVEAPRLQVARQQLLMNNKYLRLDDLTKLTRDDFQGAPQVTDLYDQAGGLAHFFMDGESGSRRWAFRRYLWSVYAGEGIESLTAAMREDAVSLAAGYRRFLLIGDADLARIPRQAVVRRLALGRTTVSDEGLAALPPLSPLEVIDLSYTAVTDRGVKALAEARQLRRLGLEGARVTDAALPTIGQFRGLVELDLSHTRVTDEGLKHLAALHQLETLWLTGAAVTDAALGHLAGLRKLNYLNVNQTGVTQTAYDRFMQGRE